MPIIFNQILKVRWNGKQFGRTIDSPKKRRNESGFFLFFWFEKHKSKQNNFDHSFLGESTARQSAFGFIWPLVASIFLLTLLLTQGHSATCKGQHYFFWHYWWARRYISLFFCLILHTVVQTQMILQTFKPSELRCKKRLCPALLVIDTIFFIKNIN